MTVRIEVSEEINRPISDVFTFYADNHVRNHPRWDPNIELWLDSDDPLGVGSIIRRRNNRSGTPVEGTMEVVEFKRDEAFGVVIHDGPMEVPARATFRRINPNVTKLTVTAEFPVDDSMEPMLQGAMQGSLTNIKQLMAQGDR